MKTVFFSDKERLEFLSSRFPQEAVEGLYDRLCAGWAIEQDFDTLLAHLEGTTKTLGLEFMDKEIQFAYKYFNKRAEVLSEFMEENMRLVRIKKKGEIVFERYEISNPRRDKHFDQAKEEVRVSKLKQLTKLGLNFGKAYVSLMKIGMHNLERDSQNLSPVETQYPKIVGRNLQFNSEEALPLTKKERELLQLLMSKVKKHDRDYHEYELVKNGSLLNLFRSKRSYENIYRRLMNKKLRRTVSLQIIKDNEQGKRLRISGYRLIIQHPQKMRGIERS